MITNLGNPTVEVALSKTRRSNPKAVPGECAAGYFFSLEGFTYERY
jgi:hypothetical protein